jgi:hypothetical protein
MDQLEKLRQIKEATDFIVNGMMSGCIQMSAAAGEAYREIVDQFYHENKGLMSSEQYVLCRNNYVSFLSCIDLAMDRCRAMLP